MDATAPIHVLHVDDEPDFAALTARHLERESERLVVQTATTAEEAFELLSEEIDCVVSDYWMPETNGLELFEEIKERYPDLPFILFTDTGSEAVASEAISAGVTDYLIKGVVAEQSSILAKNVVTAVEKRRAEQRAAATERQLHELADQTEDVLWTFSADWSELQFINDAYEDVFEQPVERVREQPDAFLEAIHPHDRDRVRLTMGRVSEGGSERIQYRIGTHGDGEKWVESHAKGVTEGGSVVRVVGFTRDITDRMHWEQELERKNDQLERFASTVAHDLRNPWSVANGFLHLARADRDSDDLQTVSNALGRMDRIITDLLELARAGATIDERQPVALEGFLATCWRSVPHPEATLRVETDLTVSADPSRLAQAFENLFRNAIEHGGEDVTIRVGTLRTDSGVCLYVEDDGPGIDPIDRDSVFESGHSTTDDGTGFGLAIVNEVIEAHGWDIAVTEADGGGARFEITGIEPVPE